MRYLKRFENLESDSMSKELKDIFRDLSDDIFDVYIKTSVLGTWYDISISIYKNRSGKINAPAEDIYLYEIKDYIKRSIEYLNSEGFELIMVLPYGVSTKLIGRSTSPIENDVDKWNPNDIVMAMNVYFKEIK